MSHKELNRLEVLQRALDLRITQRKAAEILGLDSRHVRRLMHALRAEGPAALASKRRGRPSNRRLAPKLRTRALKLIQERYSDFGPTLANEKLREVHGLSVSTETLRSWMAEAQLWVPRTLLDLGPDLVQAMPVGPEGLEVDHPVGAAWDRRSACELERRHLLTVMGQELGDVGQPLGVGQTRALLPPRRRPDRAAPGEGRQVPIGRPCVILGVVRVTGHDGAASGLAPLHPDLGAESSGRGDRAVEE